MHNMLWFQICHKPNIFGLKLFHEMNNSTVQIYQQGLWQRPLTFMKPNRRYICQKLTQLFAFSSRTNVTSVPTEAALTN